MKRKLAFAAVAVLSVTGLLAETNPMIGTWKLNPAKSKFDSGPAPKSQTTTITAAGEGIKNVTKGVAADGTSIAYEYTAASLDGKEYPITGSGAPGGGDSISHKRVDGNTFDVTIKKAGKVVVTTHAVYAKDGKSRTLTNKRADGTIIVLVSDRQ